MTEPQDSKQQFDRHGKPIAVLSVQIPRAALEWLDGLAAKHDTTRSHIFRQLLSYGRRTRWTPGKRAGQ